MTIPALPMHFDPNRGGEVTFGDDSRLFVKFERRSVIDQVQSREAGRPVYVGVDYVHIQQPGERDFTLRPASDIDKARFRRQWQEYQDGRTVDPEGTPLSVLFPVNPEITDSLKYFRISTVEQLANLNDTQIQNLGLGGRQFHEAAKKYLAASEKGKGFHELTKQVEDMARDMKALAVKNAALEQALAEREDEPRRGPGRPRKDQAA